MIKNYIALLLIISIFDCTLEQPETVLFLGDSIVSSWDVYWDFPEVNAVNRGVSGSTILQVLERLEEDIEFSNPDKIVVLVGTNDCRGDIILGKDSCVIIDMALNRYRSLLAAIESYEIPCCLLSLLMVNARYGKSSTKRINSIYRSINVLLESETSRYSKCRFVDISTELLDEKGQLAIQYITDGLHLNYAGYKKISSSIRDEIYE